MTPDAPIVENGFRLRGLNMTRIETFTDAAFAFALTLLVVSMDVPRSYADLQRALAGIPAFALSFAILMVFWHGHHTWSRRYGLDDFATIALSCLLVFTVLIYVYPLKFMFRVFVGWMLWITTGQTSEIGIERNQLDAMFMIYGCGFTAMSVALLLLYAHAWRRRATLGLNAIERFDTCAYMQAWGVCALVGVLSVSLALLFDAGRFGLPGWVYMLLPIVMPVLSVWQERRRKKLEV